jgi:hypothetical protein
MPYRTQPISKCHLKPLNCLKARSESWNHPLSAAALELTWIIKRSLDSYSLPPPNLKLIILPSYHERTYRIYSPPLLLPSEIDSNHQSQAPNHFYFSLSPFQAQQLVPGVKRLVHHSPCPLLLISFAFLLSPLSPSASRTQEF